MVSGVYLNNPNLKSAGVNIPFTPTQVNEYVKCATDPEYFIKTYVKIIHVDHGLIPFDLWDFQKEMVRAFHKERFVITKLPRQSGKSTTVTSYILWQILFHDYQNIAILANKGTLARDLLRKVQLAYEYLPKWIQQGVVVWNKGDIELENGSKIVAAATSSSAIRGGSYNLIFLDEFAHVHQNMAEEFFMSTYPTISSGKTTKVIIVSTPAGMNLYYKMWVDAEEGRSSYFPISVSWDQVPGRDKKWKEETIANTSETQFQQEFECVSGTTIVKIREVGKEKSHDVQIETLYEDKKDYEILTPKGWKPFDFVQRVHRDHTYFFRLSTGQYLECSADHKVETIYGFTAAKDLDVDDRVCIGTETKPIVEMKKFLVASFLYDPVNVGDNHTYYSNGIVSHNCEFIGSSNTLISPWKIRQLAFRTPKHNIDGIEIFKEPVEGRIYALVTDVGRGLGLDYSSFSVFDITEAPYDQVATYRSNVITAILYPDVIKQVAEMYGQAYVLVEINDIGQQVSDILHYDLEYENVLMVTQKERVGQRIGGGFARTIQMGVRTTKQVKRIGCSNFKDLIENDKLIVNDFNTIQEISSFVRKGTSFEAEPGTNDDMVMTCVLFAWMTQQAFFKEITATDIRAKLYKEKIETLEAELTPFGVIDTGEEDAIVDNNGQVWTPRNSPFSF